MHFLYGNTVVTVVLAEVHFQTKHALYKKPVRVIV